MDFKTGKLHKIIREFEKGNGRYEINGIDLKNTVFLYREKANPFIPIPKGNYRTVFNENESTLIVDEIINNKAVEFQIISIFNVNASKYLEKFPELSMAVEHTNQIVDDINNIIDYLNSVGVKTDSKYQTQILTPLEPNTIWCSDNEGNIKTFPIGNLNSSYEKMLINLKKEIENFIEENKENSINNITDFSQQKISEFVEKVTIGVTKINDAYKEIETKINNSIEIFNQDEESKMREFQNVLKNKITEFNDLKNEIIHDLNAEKEKLSANLKSVIADYIEKNKEMLKGEKGDKGDTGYVENLDIFEPKIKDKKTGFNLDKTDNYNENDTNKLVTAKALDNLYTDIKKICPYSIGDIYITTNVKNPAIVWIGTSWEKIENKFLRATNSGENAGIIGGNDYKTLSIDNLPTHNHNITINNNGSHNHTESPHNHTQPTHTHAIRVTERYSGEENYRIPKSEKTRLSYSYIGSGETIVPAGGENTGSAQPIIYYNGEHTHSANISNVGNGSSFDIKPAYYTVYIWKRIG